jgi:hypothetical protein
MVYFELYGRRIRLVHVKRLAEAELYQALPGFQLVLRELKTEFRNRVVVFREGDGAKNVSFFVFFFRLKSTKAARILAAKKWRRIFGQIFDLQEAGDDRRPEVKVIKLFSPSPNLRNVACHVL